MCSSRLSSTWSTSGTRHVTPVNEGTPKNIEEWTLEEKYLKYVGDIPYQNMNWVQSYPLQSLKSYDCTATVYINKQNTCSHGYQH